MNVSQTPLSLFFSYAPNISAPAAVMCQIMFSVLCTVLTTTSTDSLSVLLLVAMAVSVAGMVLIVSSTNRPLFLLPRPSGVSIVYLRCTSYVRTYVLVARLCVQVSCDEGLTGAMRILRSICFDDTASYIYTLIYVCTIPGTSYTVWFTWPWRMPLTSPRRS